MPWIVRLQDEIGNPIVGNDAVVEFEAISREAHFKLLHYIDPYGDTYFNRLQIDDFLADWNSLPAEAAQRGQLELVRDMALKCRRGLHLYLRFIGD